MRGLLDPVLLALALDGSAQVWTQLPDFPGTARDDATAFTIDGKVYIGTGMEVGWGLTNDWWCYDPASNAWTAIASMPSTPRQYCSAFTVLDTGYVFGGLDANGALNELWAYHPGTDSWEQRASMPAEARYTCIAAEGWDYGMVATGMLASGSPTNEAWKYHPGPDAWTPIAPVPGPARHRAASFRGNGVVVIGGADAAFTALNDVWWYPIWFETGEWYPSNALPAPRYGADGSGGEVWAILGGASDDTTFHADAWYQDGSFWSPLPDFPGGPRRGGVSAGMQGSSFWLMDLYYGLGLDGTWQRRKDWWRLEFPVTVPETVSIGHWFIHPDPGTDHFVVDLRHPGEFEIMVVDALGRSVLGRTLRADARIGTVDWSPGTYIVFVTDASGASYRARWIKI